MTNHFSYQFYQNTQTALDAMYEAILGARQSIYWELYIFLDDEAGKRFVELLEKKAGEGVNVKLILDSVGSFAFSSADRLRKAGAEVLLYNHWWQPNWHLPEWINKVAARRDHRKILIVDEEIGFLGGVNVAAEFRLWDDIHLKISGRPVRRLLYGFAKSYIKSGGERENVKRYLHPKLNKLEQWTNRLDFIFHSPGYNSNRRLWGLYKKAVDAAKESVTFLSPYYLPDRKFLKLIARASRRGVKVKIILPARADTRLMNYVAQKYWNATEKLGAKILWLNKMHHGKAVMVDDKLGMIGSFNLTPRSFGGNEESGVWFRDEAMVKELNGILNNLEASAGPNTNLSATESGWQFGFWRWVIAKLEKYL